MYSVKFLFLADSSNITTEQTGLEIYCSLKIGLQHNDHVCELIGINILNLFSILRTFFVLMRLRYWNILHTDSPGVH